MICMAPVCSPDLLFFTASAAGPLVTPRERSAGTYERLVTSPASLGAILAGDVLAGTVFSHPRQTQGRSVKYADEMLRLRRGRVNGIRCVFHRFSAAAKYHGGPGGAFLRRIPLREDGTWREPEMARRSV